MITQQQSRYETTSDSTLDRLNASKMCQTLVSFKRILICTILLATTSLKPLSHAFVFHRRHDGSYKFFGNYESPSISKDRLSHRLHSNIIPERRINRITLHFSHKNHASVGKKLSFHRFRHSLKRKLLFWMNKNTTSSLLLDVQSMTSNETMINDSQSDYIYEERVGDNDGNDSSGSLNANDVSLTSQLPSFLSSQPSLIVREVTESMASRELTSTNYGSETALLPRSDVTVNDNIEKQEKFVVTNTSNVSDLIEKDDVRTSVKTSTEMIKLTTIEPVRDRSKMTRLELEFDDMLNGLSYSSNEIACIADLRVKSVLIGIAASAKEPAVYRAFQVLFEDLYPLRIAGRAIFKRLTASMEEIIKLHNTDIELAMSKTDLNPDQIRQLREMFVTVTSKLNRDYYISKSQLSSDAVILAEVATQVMGFDNVDDLLDILVAKKVSNDEKFTFTDLLLALIDCFEETCGLDRCDPHGVLDKLLFEFETKVPEIEVNGSLDAERQKHNERYNEMVHQFIQWKNLMPQAGKSRILDVVRGCFVGAENPKVVEALRTVYVDYSTLRFAGDIIFKLVSSALKMRGAVV